MSPQKPTSVPLEELAKKSKLVFVDNNIFFQDRNKGREGVYLNLGDQVKKAKSFYDIRQSDIDRHLARMLHLVDVCERYSQIVTVDEILYEYDESRDFLGRTFDRLKQRHHDKRYYGTVQELLKICGLHRDLYNLLQLRTANRQSAEPLVRALLRTDLHKPKDGRFMKVGNGIPKDNVTYQRDITLVANAIQAAVEEEGSIAILSDDCDIFNLVRNIGEKYRDNSPISPECSTKLKRSVTAYSTDVNLWHPGLMIVHVTDTEMNMRLRYRKRERR
ncbi:TPA: hypothetical protein HA241_07385 [Candidatus Woesearchaeota archaeon]|nr:hypothetical protein [Candidatus Woesearchaeota archaeon]